MQPSNINLLGQKPWLRSSEGLIPSLIVLPDSDALNLLSAQFETIVEVLGCFSANVNG
jgi:hypothetical protein